MKKLLFIITVSLLSFFATLAGCKTTNAHSSAGNQQTNASSADDIPYVEYGPPPVQNE